MWRKTVKEQSEEDDNADSEEEKEELEVTINSFKSINGTLTSNLSNKLIIILLQVELPLHAGVLDVNYGVPIIIICTKVQA